MLARLAMLTAASILTAVLLSSPAIAADDGVIRVKSAYPMEETVLRLKKDVAAKGIRFFDEIDQAKLGSNADIKLNPSTLLIFGNPPLGLQFRDASLTLPAGLGYCRAQQGWIPSDALDLVDNESLDLGSRDRFRWAVVPATLLGVGADIVAISFVAVAGGMRRRHGAVAGDATQNALEQGAELVSDRRPARAAVALE